MACWPNKVSHTPGRRSTGRWTANLSASGPPRWLRRPWRGGWIRARFTMPAASLAVLVLSP
eukprot:2808931-Prymnesium_polylepis.1